VTAGYSATPLAKKLGFRGPVFSFNVPHSVRAEIAETASIDWISTFTGARDAHLFVTLRVELETLLKEGRAMLPDDAIVWISWPKKTSRLPTDITEDTIREICLPMGWVDVKVCAVDDVWSGLKLVLRKQLRAANRAASKTNQTRAKAA
jgi:hypothetical protein